MNSPCLNYFLKSLRLECKKFNWKLLLYESNSCVLLKRTQSTALISTLCRNKSTLARPKFPALTMSNIKEEELMKPENVCLDQKPTKIIEAEGWITIGQYSVFAWSVSGLESCIVIKSDDVVLTFDMGIALPESLKASSVFITHGHVDHIGAVASHVSKRGLGGLKPARYFVPPHLVEPLKSSLQAHYLMAETVEALKGVNVLPFVESDVVRLNSSYFVKAFPTIHRIPSQGYILYKETKKLKPELRGLQGFEIAAMHRAGQEIHEIVTTPELAYCGDTVFDVFLNPPNPDLLKVKLLITEATFLDEEIGKNMIQKAKERGHTHLSELIQHAELFSEVGHIVLVHFSNKYSSKYIKDCFFHRLPQQLRGKVTPATVAKSTFAST
ncbi:nuclear ribonuclease Z [Biomphalaria pfeifferi]|uniref:Nuclear ribonuclease Z n=1 Tax=Biomphalaria pfeifferi TaxID=112525 RepID=A0AAD8FBG8_BIOPF|nr:nuclear ribonuclease Z [Biomphalaria pfeifferi]